MSKLTTNQIIELAVTQSKKIWKDGSKTCVQFKENGKVYSYNGSIAKVAAQVGIINSDVATEFHHKDGRCHKTLVCCVAEVQGKKYEYRSAEGLYNIIEEETGVKWYSWDENFNIVPQYEIYEVWDTGNGLEKRLYKF